MSLSSFISRLDRTILSSFLFIQFASTFHILIICLSFIIPSLSSLHLIPSHIYLHPNTLQLLTKPFALLSTVPELRLLRARHQRPARAARALRGRARAGVRRHGAGPAAAERGAARARAPLGVRIRILSLRLQHGVDDVSVSDGGRGVTGLYGDGRRASESGRGETFVGPDDASAIALRLGARGCA